MIPSSCDQPLGAMHVGRTYLLVAQFGKEPSAKYDGNESERRSNPVAWNEGLLGPIH